MGLSYSVFSLTGGGTSTTGFYLNVGSSGNTTFTFDSVQPAGVYFISSKLEDATYDIYLASDSGEAAGYTNSEILIATKEFKHVVIYGAQQNDVLILESKPTVNTIASGNIDGGIAPYVVSASPTDLESYDDTTTIFGGNFATNVEVYFVSSLGIETQAKSLVRVSSAELIATRPDSILPENGPYDLKVVNPGIQLPSTNPNSGILFDYITVGTYPVWVSTSPVFWERGSQTLQLVAEDLENSDIDYQIIYNGLWNGFTFDTETGVISTLDDSAIPVGSEALLVLRAIDTANNASSDKSFSIFMERVPINSFYFDLFATAGNLEQTLLFQLSVD